MLTQQDVQFQLFKQTAFNTDPGTPNGQLIPREPNFNVGHERNLVDNPQEFADGFEREFALGNHVVSFDGSVVPNLNFWPWIQRWLTGELATTGTGPYVHTSKITQNVIYHLLELGFPAATLYYKFYDLLISKLSFDIPIEGIWSCSIAGSGSGNVVFAGGTSLDATPTEVTGAPGEYANMAILENAVDIGIITRQTIDIERKIVEKRPHGKSGKASELRYGKTRISGVLDVYFESDALWLKARNGTLTPLKSTLTAGTDTLEILQQEAKLAPIGPKVEGEDGIMQSFTYHSIKKSSSDSPIKFTTTNATAGTAYP